MEKEKTKIAVKPTDSILNQMGERFDRIRQRAFELFTRRDPSSQTDVDDWLAAERELSLEPAIEVMEKDGRFEVDAALPGIEARNVQVEATPDELLITAVQEEGEPTYGDGTVINRSTTQMFGAVHFPTSIDPEHVTADFHRGHLKVKAILAKPQGRVEVHA